MKVLFVGEGRHDIGKSSSHLSEPRIARGLIPTLARAVCDSIAQESIALAWSEIARFNADAKKSGYPAKMKAAVLLSERKFGCSAAIFVADRDGKESRRGQLEDGRVRSLELFPLQAVACGLAVESVEAWTLGAPEAIAEELDITVEAVRAQYPAGVHVESLSERSGKTEHRPKQLLQRIAQMCHQDDSAEFREAVAVRTDIAALERACPQGFAPFAEQLRSLRPPVRQ